MKEVLHQGFGNLSQKKRIVLVPLLIWINAIEKIGLCLTKNVKNSLHFGINTNSNSASLHLLLANIMKNVIYDIMTYLHTYLSTYLGSQYRKNNLLISLEKLHCVMIF